MSDESHPQFDWGSIAVIPDMIGNPLIVFERIRWILSQAENDDIGH